MGERKIDRRSALRWMAGGAAATTLAGIGANRLGAQSRGPELTVTVLLNEPIGIIKPAIYSQFVEHLGGVVYDGVWVGTDSKIPNIDGIRRDLVEQMRKLGPIVVRWPGGCFADGYHWRDGIGPREDRPRRYGRWDQTTETNQFGTHEFLRFCELCGVTPYLAANVGTGTPQEFVDWLEYCNAPAGETTLSDLRAKNGHPEPYGIRYWGVGNESWGCGGKFTPEDYCTEYRKYTEWLPTYDVPLYLIAAGPNKNDLNWTRRFFKKWTDYAKAPIQGWAAHYYCGTAGTATTFSTNQWYELLYKANLVEPLIVDQWAALGEFDPRHKIKLIIDEWGAWHKPGTEINPKHELGQMSTMRDALVAALSLDVFNRHAEKLSMTNLAQLVNCLQSLFLADGDQFVVTPNFHVFEMYRPHQGAVSLRLDVGTPHIPLLLHPEETVDVAELDEEDDDPHVTTQEPPKEVALSRVAGSASRARGSKDLTLTLVHTHASEPAEVAIRLLDGSAQTVRRTILTHQELNACNTFDNPDEVKPETSTTDLSGSTFVCELPPASITRLDIRLN